MPEYLYLYHPYRDSFFDNPIPEEEIVMGEHFLYLQKASENGILILAGPCTDHSFGLVVFHAENDAAANEFMHNDPNVKKNTMMAELHPFHISLKDK